jgi:hypothetical protein
MEAVMVGPKTRGQFRRILERKPDPDAPVRSRLPEPPRSGGATNTDYPGRFRGFNQESEHNKHNHPPQGAQKH